MIGFCCAIIIIEHHLLLLSPFSPAQLINMSAELACSYAALILHDEEIEITVRFLFIFLFSF